MNIRKTEIKDLQTVLNIYDNARKFMVANGNTNQWSANNWPPKDLIVEDINNEKSYVCVNDAGNVIGVFYYDCGHKIEPTYNHIENGNWIGDENYGVVHRIASDGSEKGIGAFCLNYAFEKCRHLRIDTHEDNIPMQNLLKKLNFTKCGTIYVLNGTSPRIAFEKLDQ